MLFGFSTSAVPWLDVVGLFLFMAGFVVGLGAVVVIDVHGALGRFSHYWTEATTRTHKITKPLIWIGTVLAIIGGAIFYRSAGLHPVVVTHIVIAIVLVINGVFLSFRVSPYLLEREKEGRSGEILPSSWQRKILISLTISDIGWWLALFLLALYVVMT